MTLNDIRARYLAFYQKRGHTVIPSAPLVPENDPTTLFTSSGMQPLVPYLMGQKHPMGTRIVNVQRCFRAEDVDEVGDNRHTTFFEMLGNWSLGDYFKEEQLPWLFAFLVDDVGLDPSRLYVTCFAGDDDAGVPKDTQSAALWQKLFADMGIEARIADMGSERDGGARGMREGERIFFYDASKNWWSRAGVPEAMPAGEIGGPDSEVFYDFGTPHDPAYGAHCHPNCDCGRFMEIGNSVFMQYVKQQDGSFAQLPQKNVDFGGGLERIAAAANGDADVFRIDVFAPVIEALEQASGKQYADAQHTSAFRVIADHLRGAVFMMTDGVVPSNKEQGYVLRRLLRRATLYSDRLGIAAGTLSTLAAAVVAAYADVFADVRATRADIVAAIDAEEKKFRKTLKKGLEILNKAVAVNTKELEESEYPPRLNFDIDPEIVFDLYQTHGFPFELIQEELAKKNLGASEEEFQRRLREHKKLSKMANVQKFKGGLADHSAKTTAFHTATHLMLAALRKELGEHVHQAGSNITEERTRFDFTHDAKVPREVLDRVEQYVNDTIAVGATVTTTQMDKEAAREAGVEGSFWEKYPDRVTVYTVEGPDGTVYSRELCGGPHVANTADIAAFGRFTITKEQSSGAGVRRVKAVFATE